MTTDSIVGRYMKQRKAMEATTPYDIAEKLEKPQEAYNAGSEKMELSPEPGLFKSMVMSVATGLPETPKQVFGGTMDAMKEIGDSIGDFIEWMGLPSTLQVTNEKGEFDLDLMTRAEFKERGGKTYAENLIPKEARTGYGALVRDVSQFLSAFIPVTRALKTAGSASKLVKGGKVMAAGAAVDAFAFDPHEKRLANLIKDHTELESPVIEYLAADPEDGKAEGRFKNALEGAALGIFTDGFFSVVKVLRAAWLKRMQKKALELEKKQIDTLVDIGEKGNTADDFKKYVGGHEAPDPEFGVPGHDLIGEGEIYPTDVYDMGPEYYGVGDGSDMGTWGLLDEIKGAPEAKVKVYRAVPSEFKGSSINEGDWVTPDKSYAERHGEGSLSGDYVILEKEVEAGEIFTNGDSIQEWGYWPTEATKEAEAAKAAQKKEFVGVGDEGKASPRFKMGSKKAGKERALNINLSRIESPEDVDILIEDIGKKHHKSINKARREVITHEETERLADNLGMTVDDLLNRRQGEAFNAEQAVAARKILVSSGEQLITLAKKASRGGDEDVLRFRRAMSQHHGIQQQVSGMTAEAGRALSSFNIIAKSAKEQERMIKEALEIGGGITDSQQLAAMVATFTDSRQLNAFVKQASRADTKAMLYEAWINGLLSSPATHAVNILSNGIVSGWRVGERKIASLIGQATGEYSIPEGEATAQLFGMVQGMKDGFGLAWNALKTGEPSDVLTKIENQGYNAISAEALDLTGISGKAVDMIGSVVRMPSRMLTAGDEFFKAVGYRMELHAQAYRQAVGEGLEGDALATRIRQIIDDPPENIDMASVDAARYQTFTNQLGPAGQAVQNLTSKFPPARLIVPFIRTPVNIMKFVGERTVAAPLAPSIRAEIAAGGARRDMALAKMASGSMVMMVAADMVMSGQVTGGGPVNPEMKRALRATGWQPYSIKIGDEYHSYQRLDPIGATIGIAADMAEVIGQLDDATADEVALSTAVAVGQNITSKTYLSGVAEFFNVMSSVSPDPDKRLTRFKRWAERYAGSVVPAGVAQLNRTLNPELKATQGYLEKIRSRIPGFSKDLPPRRNIFGEPIVLSGGLGPDIMSPIYTSSDKRDFVADEIVEQKTLIRMPLPTIDGVRLDTRQHDQYIRFYSGEGNKIMKRPLKAELEKLFRSSAYRRGTDGQQGSKSLMIKTVLQAYRQSAKAMMLKTDQDLATEVKAANREKLRNLGG